uniref:Uncharacterized protein n=1 Tax=Aegilops tauschii TaxID=37682 RepID=M8BEI6_AEGTA
MVLGVDSDDDLYYDKANFRHLRIPLYILPTRSVVLPRRIWHTGGFIQLPPALRLWRRSADGEEIHLAIERPHVAVPALQATEATGGPAGFLVLARLPDGRGGALRRPGLLQRL